MLMLFILTKLMIPHKWHGCTPCMYYNIENNVLPHLHHVGIDTNGDGSISN